MSINSDYENPSSGFQEDGSPTDENQDNSRRSTLQNDSWLSLEIYLKANDPALLKGLDQWLDLNLINPRQVKKICRNHLSCALPEIEAVESIPANLEIETKETNKSLANSSTSSSIFAKVLRAFLDELSIRWLLFLGIFLVVVSSGVLAASQWQNFPIFGQYLVLLLYTLGFWGLGFWTNMQNSLKLTSQTLNAIATLLIPINFWAMNHLGLGNNLIEWSIIAIAIVIFSVTFSISVKQNKSENKASNNILVWLFLALSYSHLAWQIPLFPIAFIYFSIIIISLKNYRLVLLQRNYPAVNLLFILAAWLLLLARTLITEINSTPNYCLAIALLAWLIAITQSKQIKQEKTNLNLNDHLVAEISKSWLRQISYLISIILFIVAWSISVASGIIESSLFFWQTIAIGSLAIQVFWQRLILHWRKKDLTAVFLIGLQTLYVSKELIPNSWRNQALDLSVVVSKTEYFPESVFGITLFPYVILFVCIATWLYRRQKTQLAIYTESLTLLLGIILTCLSISNPTWRFLNLLLSTFTLAYVAKIRHSSKLAYGTHLFGLITVVNGINFTLPNLNQPLWGVAFIILMSMEWTIYLSQLRHKLHKFKYNFSSSIYQSCWYFGLLLGTISYTCFVGYINISSLTVNFRWGLIWLITPGMLTLIAKSSRTIKQRRLATIFSCIALIGAQLLTFGKPETRFIALTIATGLMLINAFNLRRTIITIIHLGFGLSLIASVFGSLIDNDLISNWYWLSIGGAAILGLYQLRSYLIKISQTPKFDYVSQRTAHGILGVGVEAKNFKLINKYIKAADYWAIALMIVELAVVSIIYVNLPNLSIKGLYIQYLLVTCLLPSAILWRYRTQPNNLVLYALTWWSLLGVALVMVFGGSNLLFATTNITLGLVALGVVSWLSKSNSPWAKLNLAYVPLIYAVLGMIWRLSSFNGYTGLLTLGAAFILLNIPQKPNRLNALIKYIGFGGISVGVYELVIYQIQSSTTGSVADALTILALIAAAIALTYRIGTYLIASKETKALGDSRRQNQIFNLSLPNVVLIAHIHWAISSVLKIMAAGIAIESTASRLTLVSITTSLCLGVYAVIQGRDRKISEDTSESNDWWVYVGLVEIAATLVYSRLIISKLSLFDPWRVIFTCATALLIYHIPWRSWGWRATAWQRTALIVPALMALVTAEDISLLSLIVTALFYLRIASAQKNIRWSYVSLGAINWLIIRLVWQYSTEFVWIAAIISLSILYLAQFDSYLLSHRQQRHYLRLIGSSILCIAVLFYQPGIIPGSISFGLIFIGLGLRIRAFLFTGTITLIFTAIYHLIILVVSYSFLKWVVGLLAGIFSIAIAAGFEKQRDQALKQFKSYSNKLKDWH